MSMGESQNLIDELVGGHAEGKYNKKYVAERIQKIFKFLFPRIRSAAGDTNERNTNKLYDILKEEEKVKALFSELVGEIERPIIIYVASKFKNNRYFGTKMVEEALR
ncbi:MAG: hypothetical protein AB1468_05295 [Candidatus Micrarchaeota archaeon]